MTERLALRAIVAKTARLTGVELVELVGPSRVAELARTRQRGMWLTRRLRPECSYGQIGRVFGRHPSTVCVAIARTDARRAVDPGEAEACATLLAVFERESDETELARLEARCAELRARISRSSPEPSGADHV